MAPETITQEESTPSKPTKAGDVYSYGCIMMRVRCMFSFKCHADIMQVFSGRQPYAHCTNALAVMRAIVTGREPFRQLVGINEEFKQFAQLCLSGSMEHRPLVAKIVEFLWSQTNITEAMKTMLPQLPVTVTQISQTVLTKCDYPHDGLNVLGEALKCKWVVHGSNEIEVGVFVWIYGTACNPLVDRSQSRL
jgi:serine/threonine protein kinase